MSLLFGPVMDCYGLALEVIDQNRLATAQSNGTAASSDTRDKKIGKLTRTSGQMHDNSEEFENLAAQLAQSAGAVDAQTAASSAGSTHGASRPRQLSLPVVAASADANSSSLALLGAQLLLAAQRRNSNTQPVASGTSSDTPFQSRNQQIRQLDNQAAELSNSAQELNEDAAALSAALGQHAAQRGTGFRQAMSAARDAVIGAVRQTLGPRRMTSSGPTTTAAEEDGGDNAARDGSGSNGGQDASRVIVPEPGMVSDSRREGLVTNEDASRGFCWRCRRRRRPTDGSDSGAAGNAISVSDGVEQDGAEA